MAHPEAEMGLVPKEDVRVLLNTFPRPAKAKLIRVSMISFFIVS